MKDNCILTAESVTEGHPDKLCDTIADAVVDACLTQDTAARVACEVMATAGKIIAAGEITAAKIPDIPAIICRTVREAGYGGSDYEVEVITHEQSPDIAEAVCGGAETGAGDQGILYGFACDETKELLKEAIDYVLNGDKTDGHILTAHFNCDPGREYREMMKTKLETGRLDKRQCYHIIQSFKPGEITPELALEIAKAFAQEHLDGFEVVIGTHVDRHHIHSHIVFNSVNADTGEKYHSTQQSYYQQIRAISDRLCREHGLSVIVQGAPARSVSYIEWLRQSKGQPTFRSMLEADLRDAIRDANDLGHFFLLMEHKGYEIHHGGRLGFRLRGQERFQYPGRRDPLFTEDGIRAAIQGNLEQIEAGLRPVLPARPAYQPYRKHPRYSGFLALYVHYLYLLGKIEKRQYPPRMTPHLRQAVMRFERYQAQFAFLRGNDITTLADMAAFEQRTEETLGRLTKQRTLLNVRKKKRQPLYAALADAEALEPSRALYEEGLTGMEQEFEQYMKAVKLLEDSGIPREVLKKEKAEVYEQLSEVNRKIRAEREKLKLCREICRQTPVMEQDIQKTEEHQKEVREHEHRRR